MIVHSRLTIVVLSCDTIASHDKTEWLWRARSSLSATILAREQKHYVMIFSFIFFCTFSDLVEYIAKG